MAGGDLSPVATTRLRLVRRLIFALIIVIGLAIVALQFDSVAAAGHRRSSPPPPCSASWSASRPAQTLANAIAGIMLAITQPIRIGDLVTFEEETGEVEDVRLTYTYIRLDDGRRLIVPNERARPELDREPHDPRPARAGRGRRSGSHPDADLDRAIELIADEEEEITATVAETDKEGVRLSATSWTASPRERGKSGRRAAPPLAASAPRARSILRRGLLRRVSART